MLAFATSPSPTVQQPSLSRFPRTQPSISVVPDPLHPSTRPLPSSPVTLMLDQHKLDTLITNIRAGKYRLPTYGLPPGITPGANPEAEKLYHMTRAVRDVAGGTPVPQAIVQIPEHQRAILSKEVPTTSLLEASNLIAKYEQRALGKNALFDQLRRLMKLSSPTMAEDMIRLIGEAKPAAGSNSSTAIHSDKNVGIRGFDSESDQSTLLHGFSGQRSAQRLMNTHGGEADMTRINLIVGAARNVLESVESFVSKRWKYRGDPRDLRDLSFAQITAHQATHPSQWTYSAESGKPPSIDALLAASTFGYQGGKEKAAGRELPTDRPDPLNPFEDKDSRRDASKSWDRDKPFTYEGRDDERLRQGIEAMLGSDLIQKDPKIRRLLEGAYSHPEMRKTLERYAARTGSSALLQGDQERVITNLVNSRKDTVLREDLLTKAARIVSSGGFSQNALETIRESAAKVGYQKLVELIDTYHDPNFFHSDERGVALTSTDMAYIERHHPREAKLIASLIGGGTSSSNLSDPRVRERLAQLPYEMGKVLRTIKTADQAQKMGIPLAQSQFSPFVTEMSALSYKLENGGVLDPMALHTSLQVDMLGVSPDMGRALLPDIAGVRLGKKGGLKALALPHIDQSRIFEGMLSPKELAPFIQSEGAGVGLEGYERRLEDLLRHHAEGRANLPYGQAVPAGVDPLAAGEVKLSSEQVEHYQAELAQVQRLRGTLHDPSFQLQAGHYLNIVHRAATGRGAIDYSLRGKDDLQPYQRFLAPLNNQFREGARTLGSIEELVDALQGGISRLQGFGGIESGEVDRVMAALGHDPASNEFVLGKPRSLLPSGKTYHAARLARQFPDEEADLLAQFTRSPFQEGQTVAFMGGMPGFTDETRGTRGAGLEPGTVGTLHPIQAGINFGLTQNYGMFWENAMFTQEEYTRHKGQLYKGNPWLQQPAEPMAMLRTRNGRRVPVRMSQVSDLQAKGLFSTSQAMLDRSRLRANLYASGSIEQRRRRRQGQGIKRGQVYQAQQNNPPVDRMVTRRPVVSPRGFVMTNGQKVPWSQAVHSGVQGRVMKDGTSLSPRPELNTRGFFPALPGMFLPNPKSVQRYKGVPLSFYGAERSGTELKLPKHIEEFIKNGGGASASSPSPAVPPRSSKETRKLPIVSKDQFMPKGFIGGSLGAASPFAHDPGAKGRLRPFLPVLPKEAQVSPPISLGDANQGRILRYLQNVVPTQLKGLSSQDLSAFIAGKQTQLGQSLQDVRQKGRPLDLTAAFMDTFAQSAGQQQAGQPLSPLAPELAPYAGQLTHPHLQQLLQQLSPQGLSSLPVSPLPLEASSSPRINVAPNPMPTPALEEAAPLDQLGSLKKWLTGGSPGGEIPAPTPEQLAFIRDPARGLLLKGGPGTGKTAAGARRVMHDITGGQVLPSEVLGLGVHKATQMAMDAALDPYRKLLPQEGEEFQLRHPMTYHGLASRIVFQNYADEEAKRQRSPILEQLGLERYSDNVLEDPTDEDLRSADSDAARKKMLASGQTAFLKQLIHGFEGQHNLRRSTDDDLKETKNYISNEKKRQGSRFDRSSEVMRLGQEHIASGQMSQQAGFALYQHELERVARPDNDDILNWAVRAVKEIGPDALPENLRGIREIWADEGQDLPQNAKELLGGMRGILGGQDMRSVVTMDLNQSLMQGMGGIDLPRIEESYREALGPLSPHELTVNKRTRSIRPVARYNAIQDLLANHGQISSPRQKPGSQATDVGSPDEFIMARNQVEQYKRTFQSMLAMTGVKPEAMKANLAAGKHPFAGIDFSQGGMVSPSNIATIHPRNQDITLFEHIAQQVLHDTYGLSSGGAKQAFYQMYRQGNPPPGLNPNSPKAKQAALQFRGMKFGNIRGLDTENAFVDANFVGKWAMHNDIPAHLRNLNVGLTRIKGGKNVVTAAERPFARTDYQRYINASKPGYAPFDMEQWANKRQRGGNRNAFEEYQGQTVPAFFSAIQGGEGDWLRQLGYDPKTGVKLTEVQQQTASSPPPVPVPVKSGLDLYRQIKKQRDRVATMEQTFQDGGADWQDYQREIDTLQSLEQQASTITGTPSSPAAPPPPPPPSSPLASEIRALVPYTPPLRVRGNWKNLVVPASVIPQQEHRISPHQGGGVRVSPGGIMGNLSPEEHQKLLRGDQSRLFQHQQAYGQGTALPPAQAHTGDLSLAWKTLRQQNPEQFTELQRFFGGLPSSLKSGFQGQTFTSSPQEYVQRLSGLSQEGYERAQKAGDVYGMVKAGGQHQALQDLLKQPGAFSTWKQGAPPPDKDVHISAKHATVSVPPGGNVTMQAGTSTWKEKEGMSWDEFKVGLKYAAKPGGALPPSSPPPPTTTGPGYTNNPLGGPPPIQPSDAPRTQRGGGGSPPGGGGGGGGSGAAHFGRTMARIGYELQFIGQYLGTIVDQAIAQGSEYRRATVPLAGSGTSGTEGFYNFANTGQGISAYQRNTLPMYSTTQIAQSLHTFTGLTGYQGASPPLGALTDISAMAAMSGMDPTALMGPMAYLNGSSGRGSIQGSYTQLAGQLSNLFGGNLSEENLSPTLSALTQIVPTLQGLNPMGGSQTSQALSFFKLAQNAGMTPQNFGDVSSMLGNLSQVGSSPNLQQQYTLKQLGYNMTGAPQLAQYQQEETGRQEQLAQLHLMQNINGKGLSLPQLSIQIDQAQIRMDEANLVMSGIQLQQAQVSLQGQQLQYQYGQASYGFNLAQQNALYGPIGGDYSRLAGYSFQQNQLVSQRNFMSPEIGTMFTPQGVSGLRNQEFYAGLQNQQQSLILGRSPLLSDALFQQQMKYIAEQASFYKQELALRNQQREFDRVWQKRLLDQQGAQVAMQAKAVAYQGYIYGLQQQQFKLEKQKIQYDEKQAQIQQDFLGRQASDLQNIDSNITQFLQGKGPVDKNNLQPDQLVQNLADHLKSGALNPQSLQDTIRALVSDPTSQGMLFQLVSQLASQPQTLSQMEQGLGKTDDKQLLDMFNKLKQSGAFTDMTQKAGQQNAYLQYAGTGADWQALVSGVNTIAQTLPELAKDLSPTASLALGISTIANVIGPLSVGIGALYNILGLLLTKGIPGVGTGGFTPGGPGGLPGNAPGSPNYTDPAAYEKAPPGTPGGGGIPFFMPSTQTTTDVPTFTVQSMQDIQQIAKNTKIFQIWLNKKEYSTTDAGKTFLPIDQNTDPIHILRQILGLDPRPHPVSAQDLFKQVLGLPPGKPAHLTQDQSQYFTHDTSHAPPVMTQDQSQYFTHDTSSPEPSPVPNQPPLDIPSHRTPDSAAEQAAIYAKYANNSNISPTQAQMNAHLHQIEMNTHRTADTGNQTQTNTNTANLLAKTVADRNKVQDDLRTKQAQWFLDNQKRQIALQQQQQAQLIKSAGDAHKDAGHIVDAQKSMLSQLLGGFTKGTGGTAPMGHPGFTTPHVNAEFHQKMNYGIHQGVDFAAAQGTPIGAFNAGKVKNTGFYPWGGEVDVDIGHGLTERYLHLSQIGVVRGQPLLPRQRMGLTGGGTAASGLGYWSSGAHSHVQIDTGTYGSGIDPWPIWALTGARDISAFYGSGWGTTKGKTGGALRQLHDGGVAMRRVISEIGDGNEPEAVVPLSRLSTLLEQQSTRQRGNAGPSLIGSSPTHSVTVQKLADKFEVHVHTTQARLDDQAVDDLGAQLFDILTESLQKLTGK